nr:prolyl-tRNA synthetase associated domain-containing protein [uncultured Blautia sp.]
MERVKGRPQNTEGRLDKEIRVYDLLDSLGIEYERIDHEPAMTIEACEEIDRVLEAVICKNLFLCNRQETDFYLLLIPGNKKFKTKDISAQIDSSRLSFGKPEYMEQFLDITPGSVSILGLMNDKENRVQLLIDEEVLQEEYIGCHPCINTSSLRIRTEDMVKKIIPELKHSPKLVRLP